MSTCFQGSHPLGVVSPLVRQIAHTLTSRGYRISSILRANSEDHSQGYALDVTPMSYIVMPTLPQRERAANCIYRLLKQRFPYTNLLVVGERDHVHVTLARGDGVGILNDNRKLIITRGNPNV